MDLGANHIYLIVGLFIAIIFGAFYYLHYQIDKLRKELRATYKKVEELEDDMGGLGNISAVKVDVPALQPIKENVNDDDSGSTVSGPDV